MRLGEGAGVTNNMLNTPCGWVDGWLHVNQDTICSCGRTRKWDVGGGWPLTSLSSHRWQALSTSYILIITPSTHICHTTQYIPMYLCIARYETCTLNVFSKKHLLTRYNSLNNVGGYHCSSTCYLAALPPITLHRAQVNRYWKHRQRNRIVLRACKTCMNGSHCNERWHMRGDNAQPRLLISGKILSAVYRIVVFIPKWEVIFRGHTHILLWNK